MNPSDDFQKDISNIAKIPIVSNLLNVVCQTTGMGFVAIARVTEDRWITCSVIDNLEFGLKPGDELELKTTICDEVRNARKATVIDNVAEDPEFKDHHTPAMYGFQSYISVPIIRKDGTFFGTLCAIDPKPNHLNNPQIIGMFELFTDLISFHLEAIDELDNNEVQLKRLHAELQSFAYISSHDLQEPLRKIQTFASLMKDRHIDHLDADGTMYLSRITASAERMQALINDLFAYLRNTDSRNKFEETPLSIVFEAVLADLDDELKDAKADVSVNEMAIVPIIPFQLKQLFFNLLGNSLKFASKDRQLQISINGKAIKGKDTTLVDLPPNKDFFQISFSDNGIGFEQRYSEKIFQLFQRLHDKNLYEGTGMGLAIVQKIVENHNGNIVASSQPNIGTTFDILLPMF